MSYQRLSLALLGGLLLLAALARAADPVDAAVVEKLRAALDNPSMGLKVDTVVQSDVPGMYEVQFSNGPMVYATPDGSHFIVGDLFAVVPQLTEEITKRKG